MKTRKDLSKRTPGEDLWLARKNADETAYEAARRAGWGRGRYRDAELDRGPPLAPAGARLRAVPEPSLALLLLLARRRFGTGLAGVAKALSISRVTLLAAERRADPRLVRFWQKRGFRFPAGAR